MLPTPSHIHVLSFSCRTSTAKVAVFSATPRLVLHFRNPTATKLRVSGQKKFPSFSEVLFHFKSFIILFNVLNQVFLNFFSIISITFVEHAQNLFPLQTPFFKVYFSVCVCVCFLLHPLSSGCGWKRQR